MAVATLRSLLGFAFDGVRQADAAAAAEQREAPLTRPDIREQNKALKVLVTPAERAEIAKRAGAVRLPVSSYLRELGLGYRPKSTLDHEAVLALLKVNADQGRLGGLLKLWLTTRAGDGAPVGSVRALLHKIEAAQAELARVLKRL